MDANQTEFANPFGMDETCRNCPALCETRESILHGYGDVGADILVLFEQPSADADAAGHPLNGDRERAVLEILATVDLLDTPLGERPEPSNLFFSYVTRCRHPERAATREEERNCEPFLNGEIRMINPELLLPVGQRPLEALAFEYTTLDRTELAVTDRHATTIRGRGFELVPMIDPLAQSAGQQSAIEDHLAEILDSDYRQTKGRRGR